MQTSVSANQKPFASRAFDADDGVTSVAHYVDHFISGPASPGIGVSQVFRVTNDNGERVEAGRIEVVMDDPTDGSERAAMVFFVKVDGSDVEHMRFNGVAVEITANFGGGMIVEDAAVGIYASQVVFHGATIDLSQAMLVNVGSTVTFLDGLVAGSTATGFKIESDNTRTASAGRLLQVLNNGVTMLDVTTKGSLRHQGGQLLAADSEGYFYVRNSDGVPNGTPTTVTGSTAIGIRNSTLYLYDGGWVAVGGSTVAEPAGQVVYGTGASVASGTSLFWDTSAELLRSINNTNTDTVQPVFVAAHYRASAGAGLGVAYRYESKDSAGNITTIGSMEGSWVVATDGATESSRVSLYARNANASVELLRLSGGVGVGSGQAKVLIAAANVAGHPPLAHVSYPDTGFAWGAATQLQMIFENVAEYYFAKTYQAWGDDVASISINYNGTFQWLNIAGTSAQIYFETSLGAGDTGSNYRFATSTARTAGNVVKFSNSADDLLVLDFRGHAYYAPIASTVASAGALAWNAFRLGASTLTITGTTGITALSYANFEAPTVAQSGAGVVVVTDLDSFYIAGPPTLGTDVTATRRSALRVGNGQVRFNYNIDQSPILTLNNTFGGGETAHSEMEFRSNSVVKLLVGWSGLLLNFYGSTTNYLQMQDGAQAELKNFLIDLKGTQDTTAAGFLRYTPGAHLDLVNTEAPDVIFALNRTVNFVNGTTLANQRAVKMFAPTYSADAAKVITTAATFWVEDTPLAGSNVTLTEPVAALFGGAVWIAPAVKTGASAPYALKVTGAAHLDLTDTQFRDVYFNLARTLNYAGGSTIGHAIGIYIEAATYSADSAKTISAATSLYVTGAPVAGTNVTITERMAGWFDEGRVRFDGDGTHVWEVPADGTVGVDATIDGRIPIKVGGATKYIRYYAD